jgi:uncharacterized protein (TIGR02118 family)
MIKVSVMYPSAPDRRFDMDYYCKRHMRLVQDELGGALKRVSVDRGLDGPDSPPPYVAMCHLYFDSLDAYREAFAPKAETILGDLPNFADIEPVVQISEVEML